MSSHCLMVYISLLSCTRMSTLYPHYRLHHQDVIALHHHHQDYISTVMIMTQVMKLHYYVIGLSSQVQKLFLLTVKWKDNVSVSMTAHACTRAHTHTDTNTQTHTEGKELQDLLLQHLSVQEYNYLMQISATSDFEDLSLFAKYVCMDKLLQCNNRASGAIPPSPSDGMVQCL